MLEGKLSVKAGDSEPGPFTTRRVSVTDALYRQMKTVAASCPRALVPPSTMKI